MSSARAVRSTWVATAATMIVGLGALGALGSDRWVEAGYDAGPTPQAMPIASVHLVGDEGFWLQQPPTGLLRVLDRSASGVRPGERLHLEPAGGPAIEIVEVVPLYGDDRVRGERFLLVTGRETHAGRTGRTVRFVLTEPAPLPDVPKAL
jgi:hypothetical protein